MAYLGAGPGHNWDYYQRQAGRGDQLHAAVGNTRPLVSHQDCHSLCQIKRTSTADANNDIQRLAAEFSGD